MVIFQTELEISPVRHPPEEAPILIVVPGGGVDGRVLVPAHHLVHLRLVGEGGGPGPLVLGAGVHALRVHWEYCVKHHTTHRAPGNKLSEFKLKTLLETLLDRHPPR